MTEGTQIYTAKSLKPNVNNGESVKSEKEMTGAKLFLFPGLVCNLQRSSRSKLSPHQETFRFAQPSCSSRLVLLLVVSCILCMIVFLWSQGCGFDSVLISVPTVGQGANETIVSCSSKPGIHTIVSSGRILLEPAPVGQVCVLSDENAIVWGRSYDGYAWETVDQTRGAFVCNTQGLCRVDVPKDKTYKLLTYGEDPSTVEQNSTHGRSLYTRYYDASRFLLQATFGPKKSEILSFQGSPRSWVRAQIRVPATSHRAYFRKRTNPRTVTPTFTGRPRSSCEAGSRWIQYAFIETDQGSSVQVTRNGALLTLIVNGEVRTQVGISSWQEAWRLKRFTICSVRELPGANVVISKTCKGDSITLPNPPLIQVDGSPAARRVNDLGASLVEMFAPAPGIKVLQIKEGKILPACGSSYPAPSYVLDSNGTLYRHDSRLVLMSNSVGEPASGYDLDYSPNAVKTFLNKKGCVIGGFPTTKTVFKSAPVSLSRQNILKFHNEGIYIYKVEDLRLVGVKSPCDTVTSRWEVVPGKCEPSDLDEDTRNILLDLLTPGSAKIKDITFPKGTLCEVPKGARVQGKKNVCFYHVHPDTGNVYDFSKWAMPEGHPGNNLLQKKGLDNPITKPADKKQHTLAYPSSHGMGRWQDNSKRFPLLGVFEETVDFIDLPKSVQKVEVAENFGATVEITEEDLVERCGSPGEVANDPILGNRFQFAQTSQREVQFPSENAVDFPMKNNHIKNAIWTGVVLNAPDQLRQRIAFALSQILVVTKVQVPGFEDEIYANYYDILVRNAMGNYGDVLREVTYSPMMAAMLTYENSRSLQGSFERSGKMLFPDENYAREIMQLFTIGLYQLDRAGRQVKKDGVLLKTYTNADIMDFARVFTGFRRQEARANFEGQSPTNPRNRIDPLWLDASFRDVFPKMNLYGGYLGDWFPLCTDLPPRMFLRKTAVYRYVGARNMPVKIGAEPKWFPDTAKRLELDERSFLYKALCNSKSGESCNYKSEVVLKSELQCSFEECDIDDPRLVKVGKAYYEYIRPACADLPFLKDGVKAMKRSTTDALCLNKATVSASPACCSTWGSAEERVVYDGELTNYNTAEKRCKTAGLSLCDFERVKGRVVTPSLFWTDMPCAVQMKVRFDGYVGLIHQTGGLGPHPALARDNINFFRVGWYGEAPTPENKCLGIGKVAKGVCLCDVVVKELQVFSSLPSKSQILESLSIGSLNPGVVGGYKLALSTDQVKQYNLMSEGKITQETIFEVRVKGRKRFFRNKISVVFSGDGSQRLFRNPSNLMNFVSPTVRDAEYEVDALLDHLLYYPSTPAFIAYRMIQRFVTSNPSSRYIETVANAFVQGEYERIGSRQYGSLTATIAAVLLDREARSTALDSDPKHGQLREPLLKIVHFWRSMEVSVPGNRELEVVPLDKDLGQQAMTAPNVFNFFRPEYAPAGVVSEAGLVAPEAEILTTPKTIRYINGMISSARFGLTSCFAGFVSNSVPERIRDCQVIEKSNEQDVRKSALANLEWEPSGGADTTDALGVIDELDLLLTAGRLESSARKIIAEQYDIERGLNGPIAALKVAQQLVITSPEYQITNRLNRKRGSRRPSSVKRKGNKAFKAIVYVYVSGGLDSFNLLVPLSGCRDKDMFREYTEVRADVALEKSEILPINVTGNTQVCSTFGVHNSMKIFHEMYKKKEALFMANTGVMVEPLTRDEFLAGTKRVPDSLYAHNIQTFSTQTLNPLSRETIGVLGRAHDALWETNSSPGSFSIGTTSNVLEPKGSISPRPFSVRPKGFDTFNPSARGSRGEAITDAILSLSNEVSSSIYGETWGGILEYSYNSSELLGKVIKQNQVKQFSTQPKTGISFQLEQVATLIKSRKELGMDRQAFNVHIGGLDTHSDNKAVVREKLDQLNAALTDFISEMKAQDVWDDLLIVQASEFGRTLTSNGAGTDHGWGGNYMMFGGSVKGEQIVGKYPDDLTDNGKLNIGRGRILPSLSWDAVWNGILQWYGVRPAQLITVIPNRDNFKGKLLFRKDLFDD